MQFDLAIRLLLGALVAYLIGGIPWAIVIGMRFFHVDVRKHGSGNTGATNVLRTLGWKAALPVMVLDIAKGSLAVVVATMLVPHDAGAFTVQLAQVLASVAAVLGHSYSPFIRFTGGKGVATVAGALIVITPTVLLPALGIWFAVILATRYVSLGSIVGAVSFPLLQWALYPQDTVLVVFAFLVASLVIWRHRTNVKSLLAGTERKLVVGRLVPPSDKGE